MSETSVAIMDPPSRPKASCGCRAGASFSSRCRLPCECGASSPRSPDRSPWGDPELAPDLLAFSRSALEQSELLLRVPYSSAMASEKLGGNLIRFLASAVIPNSAARA